MIPVVAKLAIAAGAFLLLKGKKKPGGAEADASNEGGTSSEDASASTPFDALPSGGAGSGGGSGGGAGAGAGSGSGLTPEQIKAESARVVRESGEILDGKRTAYSTGPSSEGDDLAAAVRAAKLAAQQETAPAPAPKPVTRPSSASSTTTRPTSTTASRPASKPAPVINVYNPNREPAAISPKDAAQALANYAKQKLAAGQGAQLGVKGKPSATVRDYQAKMGNITADGIYGPATRARGQQLGVNMPIRK